MTPRERLDAAMREAADLPHTGVLVLPTNDLTDDREAIRYARLGQARLLKMVAESGQGVGEATRGRKDVKRIRVLRLLVEAGGELEQGAPGWQEITQGHALRSRSNPYWVTIGELKRLGAVETIMTSGVGKDGVPYRRASKLRITDQGRQLLQAADVYAAIDEAVWGLVVELARDPDVDLEAIAQSMPSLDDPEKHVTVGWLRDRVRQRTGVKRQQTRPWEQMFDATVEYVAETGELPTRSVKVGEFNIGSWFEVQRRNKRAGTLAPPRAARMALAFGRDWCPPAAEMVRGGWARRKRTTR